MLEIIFLDRRLQWGYTVGRARETSRDKPIHYPRVHKDEHRDFDEHEDGRVAREQSREA